RRGWGRNGSARAPRVPPRRDPAADVRRARMTRLAERVRELLAPGSAFSDRFAERFALAGRRSRAAVHALAVAPPAPLAAEAPALPYEDRPGQRALAAEI